MTRTVTRRIVIAAATAVLPACIALTTMVGAGNALAQRGITPPNMQLASTYMPQTQHTPQTQHLSQAIYTPQVRAA